MPKRKRHSEAERNARRVRTFLRTMRITLPDRTPEEEAALYERLWPRIQAIMERIADRLPDPTKARKEAVPIGAMKDIVERRRRRRS